MLILKTVFILLIMEFTRAKRKRDLSTLIAIFMVIQLIDVIKFMAIWLSYKVRNRDNMSYTTTMLQLIKCQAKMNNEVKLEASCRFLTLTNINNTVQSLNYFCQNYWWSKHFLYSRYLLPNLLETYLFFISMLDSWFRYYDAYMFNCRCLCFYETYSEFQSYFT